MSDPNSIELAVPPRLDPADLASGLVRTLGWRGLGRRRLDLVYFDSFDWRLQRHGFEFAVERAGCEFAAVLSGADGWRGGAVAVVGPPRYAWDMPDTAWRGRLADLLEMRALLPWAELAVAREEFALMDAEGAVLLGAALETYAWEATGGPAPPSARLRLTSAKGERKALRQALERLRLEFGLESAERALGACLLSILGRIPEDPSALPDFRLDPQIRADTAAKRILRGLLATLRINEAGTQAGTDTEFLHDYRVAARRTRAALGQIKAVFPDSVVRRYARKFAELGQTTSEPRDLDVYLLDFERHRQELPAALRADLDPLRELLARRAKAAHARLNRSLGTSAYQRWVRSWERFLDLPPPQRPRAKNALLPTRELAGRRIWKLYRRVVREGLAVAPESPAEQVHELRKTAKKLRYLMELFRSLYPPEKIGPLLKALKGLQTWLGDYQDAHAQIAQLRQYAEDLRQAGAPAATLLAMGALLDRRYAWEQRLREGFPELFAEFTEESHRRKFRQLFKPGQGEAEG
jgi:CHAD domain-containing protein